MLIMKFFVFFSLIFLTSRLLGDFMGDSKLRNG